MKKKEFIRRVTDSLNESNIRKPISVPKHILHISDDEGRHKDFVFRQAEKTVMYTVDDVEAILDACLKETERAICHGEEISIFGFGSLGVHKRAADSTKIPGTDQTVEVSERYTPKFSFGTNLRAAARIYEASLEEIPYQLKEYVEQDEPADGGREDAD